MGYKDKVNFDGLYVRINLMHWYIRNKTKTIWFKCFSLMVGLRLGFDFFKKKWNWIKYWYFLACDLFILLYPSFQIIRINKNRIEL